MKAEVVLVQLRRLERKLHAMKELPNKSTAANLWVWVRILPSCTQRVSTPFSRAIRRSTSSTRKTETTSMMNIFLPPFMALSRNTVQRRATQSLEMTWLSLLTTFLGKQMPSSRTLNSEKLLVLETKTTQKLPNSRKLFLPSPVTTMDSWLKKI